MLINAFGGGIRDLIILPGDTIDFNYWGGGFITTGGKEVWITAPLNKVPSDKIQSAEFSTIKNLVVRQDGHYLINKNWDDFSYYIVLDDSGLRVRIDSTETLPNAVNNSAVGVVLTGSLQFS